MSRTRVRRRGGVLLVGGAVVAALWSGTVANALDGSPDPVPPAARGRTYVVRAGDTLWSIALRIEPERDPRPVVDAILAANGVRAGSLIPGQTLSIPG